VNRAILIVDRKHPGTVEYRGKTVRLTSKQFWLLETLAENPGKCVPYNTIYDKIWGGDVMVEMQQISYPQGGSYSKKIQKVAPKSEIKIIDTQPVSGGERMVLNMRPEEIAPRGEISCSARPLLSSISEDRPRKERLSLRMFFSV